MTTMTTTTMICVTGGEEIFFLSKRTFLCHETVDLSVVVRLQSQARSQGGANGCNGRRRRPPPPPLIAWLAMNFVTSMFILLTIYTYSDSQLSDNSSVVLCIAHFRPTCT